MNAELQHCVDGLTGLAFTSDARRVNLVLISLNVKAGFAGLTTALRAGVLLAGRLGLSLRVMVLKDRPEDFQSLVSDLNLFLTSVGLRESEGPVEVLYLEDLESAEVGPEDHWLVTFWMTAYALGRLSDEGLVRPTSVTYLIQDFEPGFYAFGTEYALSLSTYTLRFNWLVNSESLAGYLSECGFLLSERRLVFAPAIDRAAIEQSARNWRREPEQIRVLFYGRPNHPRNMFDLGVQALRIWIQSSPVEVHKQLVVCSIGGYHENLDLGRGIQLRALGKTSLTGYYEQLSRTDMGLALMLSPHPSHLALEMPMAGIPTLTNSFHNARRAWLSKLRVHEPTPDALAAGLNVIFREATELHDHRFERAEEPGLGRSLSAAIAELQIN
jgi:hypothetical protein